MLSPHEIKNLEKKWLVYKIKKFSLFVFIFLFMILCFLIYFYFDFIADKYNDLTKKEMVAKTKTPLLQEPVKQEINTTKETEKQEDNKSKTTATAPEINEINDKNTSKKEDSSTEQKEIIETKTPQKQIERSLSLNTSFLSHIGSEKTQTKPQTTNKEKETIEQESNQNKTSEEQKEANATKTKKEKIKKEPQQEEKNNVEPEEKPKIILSSEPIDTVKYLKNKFYESNSVTHAIMIAEEFYEQKNYQKALKWAIISNDLDNTNERSWIIFAKSKMQLGSKEEAINALEHYLKNTDSKKAKTLLRKIKYGDFNE